MEVVNKCANEGFRSVSYFCLFLESLPSIICRDSFQNNPLWDLKHLRFLIYFWSYPLILSMGSEWPRRVQIYLPFSWQEAGLFLVLLELTWKMQLINSPKWGSRSSFKSCKLRFYDNQGIVLVYENIKQYSHCVFFCVVVRLPQ